MLRDCLHPWPLEARVVWLSCAHPRDRRCDELLCMSFDARLRGFECMFE